MKLGLRLEIDRLTRTDDIEEQARIFGPLQRARVKIAKLDGEQVISCEPSPGYMHRGYEKLTEVRTYPQVTTLINRIDWLGSFANEVPFILAAEKLMDKAWEVADKLAAGPQLAQRSARVR